MNELYKQAVAAAKLAYAPYSKFKVGAAIRTRGKIYSGCNVENVSYSQTVCAEASAISNMVLAGENKIAEICVYSPNKGGVVPCGGCLQKILEFADEKTLVHISDETGIIATHNFNELMPISFGSEYLE